MNLYAKYIAEREGGILIERENAFLSYKTAGKECFLMNMFIDESARGSGLCRELINELEASALDVGCEVITANISVADPGASHTMLAALKLGFRLEAANGGVLLISKSIGGE